MNFKKSDHEIIIIWRNMLNLLDDLNYLSVLCIFY